MNKPQRMCVSCRQKADKSSFIKVVKVGDEIIVDPLCKVNGRGMYVCKNDDCISRAIKSNAINRAFKMQIEPAVYEELRRVYEHTKD